MSRLAIIETFFPVRSGAKSRRALLLETLSLPKLLFRVVRLLYWKLAEKLFAIDFGFSGSGTVSIAWAMIGNDNMMPATSMSLNVFMKSTTYDRGIS